MSEVKTDSADKKKILIKRLPLFIKKDKITILNGENARNTELLLKNMKLSTAIQPLYKEDLIYESQNPDFLKGESHNMVIVNRLNMLTNSSRTVAKYTSQADVVLEKTSDSVTRLIGQKNYDTLLTALCSVISQELKIRAILALLTIQKKISSVGCQTNLNEKIALNSGNIKSTIHVEKSSQTDESCIGFFFKSKQRKRIKRQQLTPYVVKDKPSEKALKKVIINPNSVEDRKHIQDITINCFENINKPSEKALKNVIINTNIIEDRKNIQDITINCFENVNVQHNADVSDHTQNKETEKSSSDEKKVENKNDKTFPDLKHYVDEDSNISSTSLGNCSLSSLTSLDLTSDKTAQIFNEIDRCTDKPSTPFTVNPTILTMFDGSKISIPVKPEDPFHLITPEIMKNVTHEERKKLMWQQAFLDWKYCLVCDEDSNLPIHVAVINNDLNLLRRQCLVLKSRHETVDITTKSNLTALQMSILQNSWPQCTTMLLQYGADPLLADNEQRTCLHLAAEGASLHLKAIINYCTSNARQILYENEELWMPHYENSSNEELAKILFLHMSTMCDNQGYTPLMLASKLGNYENVQQLVEIAPNTINMSMPNCGNTALYLAVGAACLDAVERSNKSKVAEHFVKSIEVLVENGADPAVDNHSGGNVNVLLTEFNIGELSMLIANKLTSVKYFDGEMPSGSKNFDAFMLVRDKEGKVNIKEMNSEKLETKEKRASPVIIGNVPIKKDPDSDESKMLRTKHIVLPQNFKFENPKCFVNATQMQPTNSKVAPVMTKIVDRPANIILKSEKLRRSEKKSTVKAQSKVDEQAKDGPRTASRRKPSGPLDLSVNPSSSKKMRT